MKKHYSGLKAVKIEINDSVVTESRCWAMVGYTQVTDTNCHEAEDPEGNYGALWMGPPPFGE